MPSIAGLMIVYIIVAADILSGNSGGLNGLLCDWFGGGQGDWCSNRRLAAGVVLVLILIPMCSPK